MLNRLRSASWRRSILSELRAGPRALRHTLPWALRSRLGTVRTLLDVVLRNATTRPNDLAIEMGAERLTWFELDGLSSRIARVLRDAGVRKGDVVAVLGHNSPFYVALLIAVTRLGGTSALINTNLRSRPLAHAVRVSGAKKIVVEHELKKALDDSQAFADAREQVLVFGGGDMDDAVSAASSTPLPPADVPTDDDFVYIYTSGTTGLPKPCRVSHARAVLAGAAAGTLLYEFTARDKLYCVLPLYHSSALLLGVAASIVSGTPVALRRSFSAREFWADVKRYNATAILYIGELCRYLLNTPATSDERPNTVRVAVGNGLRPDIWATFQQRFEVPQIREFYGATEAPGGIVNLSGREGSVGRVPFGGLGMFRLVRFDVERDERIRTKDGLCIPCRDDEVGELLIRLPRFSGPGMDFRGYTDHQATEKKILRDVFGRDDAYFRSGDLLRRDADGFYYFVDRIGDTFRWKGENVSTAEVADEISQSSAFQEVTVVGVQVPNMDGQAGLAAVVPNGAFDPASFERAVASLPGYARPAFVRVVSDLDRTGTFKIQKSDLRQQGVDPHSVSDPLFLREGDRYTPLTPDRWQALIAGEIRL